MQSRVWDFDDLDSQNLFKPISAVTNLGNRGLFTQGKQDCQCREERATTAAATDHRSVAGCHLKE